MGSMIVFVLDDGGDEELQSFCNDLNVRDLGRVLFIRREKVKGVPHNFKCCFHEMDGRIVTLALVIF